MVYVVLSSNISMGQTLTIHPSDLLMFIVTNSLPWNCTTLTFRLEILGFVKTVITKCFLKTVLNCEFAMHGFVFVTVMMHEQNIIVHFLLSSTCDMIIMETTLDFIGIFFIKLFDDKLGDV